MFGSEDPRKAVKSSGSDGYGESRVPATPAQ